MPTGSYWQLIRQDLETFGIAFESWFSEASLLSSGTVEQVLSELKTRDLLFDQDGAQWFRSSAFGDEKDRVVRKQEGDYTYLASDIAYHRDKLRRGFDLLVDVWGADHHGYIPRMQAVVQAYGYPEGAAEGRAGANGQSLARRPEGRDVEAGRRVHHASRSDGRGRGGCREVFLSHA